MSKQIRRSAALLVAVAAFAFSTMPGAAVANTSGQAAVQAVKYVSAVETKKKCDPIECSSH